MSKIKEELALKRYREFYTENFKVKGFIQSLLDKGYDTPSALKEMRHQFCKEYYVWKKQKGYKKTWTDVCYGVLERNFNEKIQSRMA